MVSKANKSRPEAGRYKLLLISCIAVITFLCYSRSLSNQFTNWDDDVYVVNNPFIKNLTADNLKMVLFHNITGNYFHPLTMLSLATNYQFSKMEPFGYYFTNITIHVLNTCLMFFLVFIMLEAMEKKGYGEFKGKEWLAALGAILYGIHPMHVESVAWLAERKDVLYAFFYFLGMIMYIRYSEYRTTKRMVYVVLCFFLSLASKPLAVTFPLSLFAMDVLLKRDKEIKISKLISEKILFVIICIASGLWSYYTADKGHSITSLDVVPLYQRVLFASHSFMMYIFNAFAPSHLSSYHPYPHLQANGLLPYMYYFAPLIDIVIVGVPMYLAYRAGEKYFRLTLFGFLFYFFNVIFILQLITAGRTIMSERYTYIAYFGIFFMVVYFVHELWQKPVLHMPIQAGLGLFICLLGYQCYSRTKVWHNTETLWRDVIDKYPGRTELAYNSLGSYYFKEGSYDSAFGYYKIAIAMHSHDPKVYCNIANIYGMRRQLSESLHAYSEALTLDSNDAITYLDRAVTYSSIGKYDSAALDYDHSYRLDSTSENLLRARAFNNVNARRFDKAIPDYKKLILINPNVPFYYQKLGLSQAYSGDTASALVNLKHCLAIDPNSGSGMLDISVAYKLSKNYRKALEFAIKAKQSGYKVPDVYISDLQQSVNSLPE